MRKIEVLISAMHQQDDTIFHKTNINSDALLINQCDREEFCEQATSCGILRVISTTERGLSRSRNMALEYAKGDVCLICDDDEILYDAYPQLISKAYEDYADADLICFQVKREGKKYPNKPCRVKYLKSLRIASWQITMRIKSIREAGIRFDTNFGSGTPVGAGEENIFMFDCLKKGLKIYYVPICIGEVAQLKSNWFHGFNKSYFFSRGCITKRLLGKFLGSLYCIYFAVTKYGAYRSELSIFTALRCLFSGLMGGKREKYLSTDL